MATTNGSTTNGATTNGNGLHQELYTIPLQIGGKDVQTETFFDVKSPSTGEKIWRSCGASKKDAITAIEAAQEAFETWSKTKPAFRRDILMKAASIFEARADECRTYMMEETGSQRAFFDHLNLPLTAEMIRDCAGRISAATNGYVPTAAQDGVSAIVYKEPYGVVLGIAPWNAPYILGMRSILYPIAAGNTAILKGPEFAPRTAWVIGDIFREAGLPAGVLNVIVHRPQDAAEVTESLIAHPYVRKINFTGSTAVGSIIASTAGKYLKPVLMELGGKASAIILSDADLDKAAKACATGAFFHSGQICMSTERIVVHESVADEFRQKFKAIMEEQNKNGPAPVLITAASVEKSKKLIRNAVEKGASLLVGDIDVKETSETRLRPIIIDNVNKDMDIYHQETFGPSVSIIVVQSEDEAIKVANDTDYGLAGAVFTENLATGFRVGKKVQAGAVHINSMTVHDEVSLPHGGLKKSGFGRFNATAGLDEFLATKTLTWQD